MACDNTGDLRGQAVAGSHYGGPDQRSSRPARARRLRPRRPGPKPPPGCQPLPHGAGGLLYLRQNLSQALLAELFGCSRPTVSRLITRLTPVITTVLTPNAERAADRDLRSTVRVDGFVAPTGDRRKDTYTSGMYSGKRHRCGFNIQVVGSIHGRLVLTGAPQPGAMHDAKAWRQSGLAAIFKGRLHADGGPGASPTPLTPAPACAYPFVGRKARP
ncbi:transposase family protein [Catellatospora bangladeshensis]|uniref:transposase family protein n=1 Tax=Catellatospora bangladeshensis TaxID=310355 RepID=UPI0036100F0A